MHTYDRDTHREMVASHDRPAGGRRLRSGGGNEGRGSTPSARPRHARPGRRRPPSGRGADGSPRNRRGHGRSTREVTGWGPRGLRRGSEITIVFIDRRDAGRRLAALLTGLAPERPLVVALPRGGVPVAFEVARALRAPLDVLAVRKLGAPGNAELGVGAIAEGGNTVLDGATAARVGMTQEVLDATVAREGVDRAG